MLSILMLSLPPEKARKGPVWSSSVAASNRACKCSQTFAPAASGCAEGQMSTQASRTVVRAGLRQRPPVGVRALLRLRIAPNSMSSAALSPWEACCESRQERIRTAAASEKPGRARTPQARGAACGTAQSFVSSSGGVSGLASLSICSRTLSARILMFS